MSRKIRPENRKSVSPRRSRKTGNRTDYNLLEQRLALTTFVVTTLADGIADDGQVTLREAIVAANTNAVAGDAAAGDADGDAIRFDSSLAGGTINLTEGQLTISDDLAIQAGSLNITVDAQNLSRAFEITGTERVSLGRINVTGGNANIGGGVLASGSGNVIIFGGEYSNNVATGIGGGAIYSSGESTLIVNSGAIFDGNIASGVSGSGGAIFNVGGTAVATDAVFTANVANRAGGAIEITGGDLFLTDTIFGGSSSEDGNIAGPAGSASPGNGGAVHVSDGDQVSITDSIFTNNFAAREGGALWNQAGTTVFINGSDLANRDLEGVNFDLSPTDPDRLIGLGEGRTRFDNNTAAGDAANDGGGAIFNNGGDLVVNGGVFTNNRANGMLGSGGAVFSTGGRVLFQSDTNFARNSSERAGGAVEIIDGEIFDTNSGYSDNDTGDFPEDTIGNGGAIHITGTADLAINGSVFDGNAARREGGAVWNSAESTLFITDAEFDSNFADGSDADNGGGAIFNNGGDVFIRSSVFEDNTAFGAGGGSGGAIFSVDGRVLVQGDSEFTGNSSIRAGGAIEIIDGEFFDTGSVYTENDTGITLPGSPGNGGAFHITGTATAAFEGTEFVGNLAASEGGAVWNAAGSTTFLTDVEITGNIASGDQASNGGGGIFNNGGRVFVNNSTVSNNQADGVSGSGGGVFSVDGLIRFDNSTIDGNQAARAGGGVEVIDGRAFFRTVTLDSNTTGVALEGTPGNGGALHVTGNEANVTFSNSTITNNSAANQGGGLWNQIGSLLFLDSSTTVANNTAQVLGGGVYNRGFLSALDTAFADNRAEVNGGAIYITPTGSTRIENSSLSSNTAGNDGGGVFNFGSVFTQGSTFENNVADNTGGAIFRPTNASTRIGLDNFFAGNLPNDLNAR